MNIGSCLSCGHSVQGRVKNIALTLYCSRCVHAIEFLPFETTTPPEFRQPWLWWESLAKAYWKGEPEDLEALHFEIASHRSNSLGPFEKRYIAAEVRALTHVPRERCAAEVQLRRNERTERKLKLERETGIQLEMLDPYVRHFWLGDYLSGALYTATDRDTVIMRCGVLPRVLNILDAVKATHPADAFHFCLEYPLGGPEEFLALKEKTRQIFQSQGMRILGLLDKRDVEKLEGTALHDIYVDYVIRDRRACIRGYLESMMGMHVAKNILEDACCLQRIDEGYKRVHTDREIAQQLAHFWKERARPDERRRRLRIALASRGLHPPQGDRCCEAYIAGEGCLLLEELVRHVLVCHMSRF